MDNIKKLDYRPFTRFCMSIGAVPTSYLAGLTIEEQLLWLCSYLEKEVIPAVNNNAEAVEELQNLYIELKNYVDTYFDNLDVQEEINNKLDAMAESGDLGEIISQYITTNIIRSFNNIDDLKNNTDLEENMTVNVLGRFGKNDGLGSLYFIREKANEDVESDNLIFLQNNLVAEKINNYSGTTTKNDLYGIRNNACIINTNNTGITAQIMGFHNDNELATYANRDHVISYKEFRCKQPNMYAIVSVTETSVTLNSNPTNIHIGSIIDLYEDNNFVKTEKYSGFVTNIQNNVVSVDHWYYYNNTATGQVPTNVSLAVIDMPTKVWVNNDNLIIPEVSNVKEGVIAEYGLIPEKSTAKANGIDVVNLGGSGISDFAYQCRGSKNRSIAVGFLANSTGENYIHQGYLARDCEHVLRAERNGQQIAQLNGYGGFELTTDINHSPYMLRHGNKNFEIDGNGYIQTLCYKTKNYTTSGATIDLNNFYHNIQIGNSTFTLPNGKNYQAIKIKYRPSSGSCTINTSNANVHFTLNAGEHIELLYDGSVWTNI